VIGVVLRLPTSIRIHIIFHESVNLKQALAPDLVWSLGTKQRLSHLNVPAFSNTLSANRSQPVRTSRLSRLHLLPTKIPTNGIPIENYLKGGLIHTSYPEDLSLFFRYLSSPLRIEPYNSYLIHRAVPSARCLYPLGYFLLHKTDKNIMLWRYISDYHALIFQEKLDNWPERHRNSNTIFLCIAELWRIADKYGDYSTFPCALEAGMLRAQACQLAAMLGWNAQVGPPPPELHIETNILELPMFSIGLSTTAFPLEKLATMEVMRADWTSSTGLNNRFPLLKPISRAFTEGNVTERSGKSEFPTPSLHGIDMDVVSLDVLQLMRQRSSGNDINGFSPKLTFMKSDFLRNFLTLYKNFSMRRHVADDESRLMITLVWLHPSGLLRGVYDLNGRLLSSIPPLPIFHKALPDGNYRYNAGGFVMSVMICADQNQLFNGTMGLRNIHLAAGSIAHDMCLAASGFGLFSRPLRMLREDILEDGLRLPGKLVYQLMIGINRNTLYGMDLL